MYDIVYVKLADNVDGYNKLKQDYPHAILLDNYTDIVNAMQRIKKLCFTNMYWLVTDAWQKNDSILAWRPWAHDKLVPYFWTNDATTVYDNTSVLNGDKTVFSKGLYLLPLDYDLTETELHNSCINNVSYISGSSPASLPFDIFFVSYNEANADSNWQSIKQRFPTAKRVHGIKGIDNAHRRCAELSVSGMFWTIDADTIVHDDFNFDYVPAVKERPYLYIWHSLNPVNGLEYGWGSIKLWHTKTVLDFDGNWLDFTTTVGNIRMMPDVVATSAFNTDEWTSWRSGFREAVKLCVNVANGDYKESVNRLVTWLTVANPVDYAVATRDGAIDGVNFYLSASLLTDLLVINNFDLLQPIFKNRQSNLSVSMTIDQLIDKLKAHQLA